MKKTLLLTSVTAAALLSVLASTAAHAQTLVLGSSFVNMNFTEDGGKTTINVGGGSIVTSTLNGVTLPFAYCVDINHVIYAPGTYNPTAITNNGMAFGSAINNAGQVAWLLDHYAVAAEGNTDLQGGLQAAIWHSIYGANYYIVSGGNSTTNMITDYNTDIKALGSNTDAVSNIKWLSPSDSNGTRYQALATITNVPEPGVVAMAAGMLISGSVLTLRRRRARK